MGKVAVIGHFGFGENLLNGQTIKTKVFTEGLQKKYGEENVELIDSRGGIMKRAKMTLELFTVFKNNDSIIMLPAHNGLLVFTPLLSFFNSLFRKKLHYVVIGGWLAEYLDKHKLTYRLLAKKFAGIYVETSVMKRELEERGLENVLVLPNHKEIDPINEDELDLIENRPVRICTFSRVSPQKGIEEAISAAVAVNEKAQRTILSLDVYGAVEKGFEEKFESLIESSPEYVSYGGAVDFDKTVGTLKKYDLQLFPTKLRTEGIPGCIVESYFAGTPVLASRWNSFEDVVEEGVTGIGFEFGNYDDFVEKLEKLVYNYDKINEMKKECIKAAEEYKTDCREKMELYF